MVERQQWTGGRVMLCVLQVFIGVGGALGGIAFIADPTGGGLGLSIDLLEGSPFSDYLLTGVLGVIIGGAHLGGGLATLRGVRRAGDFAMGLGVLLMAWIGAMMALLGHSSGLLPSFFALGLLEILQGLLLRGQDGTRQRRAR